MGRKREEITIKEKHKDRERELKLKLTTHMSNVYGVMSLSVAPRGMTVLWIKNLSLPSISRGTALGACIVTTLISTPRGSKQQQNDRRKADRVITTKTERENSI